MGKQVELAREAFERVRAGEDIAHVSGGDPNVYGKSDLCSRWPKATTPTMSQSKSSPASPRRVGGGDAGRAAVERLLYGLAVRQVARLGRNRGEAPGGRDQRLRRRPLQLLARLRAGRRRSPRGASGRRARGIVNDSGRGEAGRNLDDETETITTLGELPEHDDEVGGMGTSIVVGTHETEPWSNDYQTYLVTPRGGRDVDDF